jgi:hypothetical protein
LAQSFTSILKEPPLLSARYFFLPLNNFQVSISQNKPLQHHTFFPKQTKSSSCLAVDVLLLALAAAALAAPAPDAL